jgi:hypothetical protein
VQRILENLPEDQAGESRQAGTETKALSWAKSFSFNPPLLTLIQSASDNY